MCYKLDSWHSQTSVSSGELRHALTIFPSLRTMSRCPSRMVVLPETSRTSNAVMRFTQVHRPHHYKPKQWRCSLHSYDSIDVLYVGSSRHQTQQRPTPFGEQHSVTQNFAKSEIKLHPGPRLRSSQLDWLPKHQINSGRDRDEHRITSSHFGKGQITNHDTLRCSQGITISFFGLK